MLLFYKNEKEKHSYLFKVLSKVRGSDLYLDEPANTFGDEFTGKEPFRKRVGESNFSLGRSGGE